jgi:hypothetical protein
LSRLLVQHAGSASWRWRHQAACMSNMSQGDEGAAGQGGQVDVQLGSNRMITNYMQLLWHIDMTLSTHPSHGAEYIDMSMCACSFPHVTRQRSATSRQRPPTALRCYSPFSCSATASPAARPVSNSTPRHFAQSSPVHQGSNFGDLVWTSDSLFSHCWKADYYQGYESRLHSFSGFLRHLARHHLAVVLLLLLLQHLLHRHQGSAATCVQTLPAPGSQSAPARSRWPYSPFVRVAPGL